MSPEPSNSPDPERTIEREFEEFFGTGEPGEQNKIKKVSNPLIAWSVVAGLLLICGFLVYGYCRYVGFRSPVIDTAWICGTSGFLLLAAVLILSRYWSSKVPADGKAYSVKTGLEPQVMIKVKNYRQKPASEDSKQGDPPPNSPNS